MTRHECLKTLWMPGVEAENYGIKQAWNLQKATVNIEKFQKWRKNKCRIKKVITISQVY